MLKRILFVFIFMFVTSATFVGVLWYDRPVHYGLAAKLNRSCIKSVLDDIVAMNKVMPEAIAGTFQVPVEAFCECMMPSTRNQMDYMTFSINLWDWWTYAKFAKNSQDPKKDYEKMNLCFVEFTDTLGVTLE